MQCAASAFNTSHDPQPDPRRGRQSGISSLCQTLKSSASWPSPASSTPRQIVSELVEWLKARGVEARLDEEAAQLRSDAPGLSRDHVPDGTQLVIVLGGDGTLLSAARAVAGREIPLFPVNMGGLGFLTAITLDQLYPELERALKGEQRIVPRRMLHGDLVRGGRIIKSYEALNDIVINKTQIARMIDLETLRRLAVRQHLQGRRSDCRDAHRLHRLFAVGGRPHRVSGCSRALHHAGLPAHFDQSAGDRSRVQPHRDHLPRRAQRRLT